jgi:hypothetical protein
MPATSGVVQQAAPGLSCFNEELVYTAKFGIHLIVKKRAISAVLPINEERREEEEEEEEEEEGEEEAVDLSLSAL